MHSSAVCFGFVVKKFCHPVSFVRGLLLSFASGTRFVGSVLGVRFDGCDHCFVEVPRTELRLPRNRPRLLTIFVYCLCRRLRRHLHTHQLHVHVSACNVGRNGCVSLSFPWGVISTTACAYICILINCTYMCLRTGDGAS